MSPADTRAQRGNRMSLWDFAQDMIGDFSHSLAKKRWQSRLISAKLRDLRSRMHLTQAEVAKRAGISESAVQNYELMRSTPKDAHLEALAKALDIRPEALRIYDIDFMPANALIQLGDVYGLKPHSSDKRFAYLTASNEFMSCFLRKWSTQYISYKNGDIEAFHYEQWKDQFAQDYDPADFPLRYEQVEYDWLSIEPWSNVQFASALRRLREKKGYTQEDLANVTGITKSAIRSYEQKKRLPKTSQLAVLSLALDVTEGALTFFDFGSPVQAAHALFQIANTYALIPDVLESGEAVLRTVRPGLEQIIDQWADELAAISTGTAERDYQSWKDVYNPEADYEHGDFRNLYAGRSRYEYVTIDKGEGKDGNMIIGTDRCSQYDPYDYQYKNGFLRA